MLEFKVYFDGENEVVVDGNVEGRSNECCAELCKMFDSILTTIAENEEPDIAEQLELATVATIVSVFIGRKTGKLGDKCFMEGMKNATVQFLHGNIMMNSPEGREKIIERLEKLFDRDGEQEQPDGDPDGEK